METQWKSNFWELKTAAGLTFDELSEQSGISTFILQKVRRGENVTLKTLVNVCLALGCTSLDQLVTITPNGHD